MNSSFEKKPWSPMSSSLRVLEITARADHGGGPRHLELLMHGCTSAVCFFVACPHEPPYYERFAAISNGRTVIVPHRAFRTAALLRLVSCVRQHKIQIIHSHGRGAGIYASLLAAITRVPWVHTPHGAQGLYTSKSGPSFNHLLEKVTSLALQHIIFVSRDERNAALQSGLWTRVPYSVIYNGVMDKSDQDRVTARTRTRAELSISDTDFVVATISRYNYQKNMDAAYRIARAMPDVTFLWLGDGPDRDALHAKACTSNSRNIRFIQRAGSSDAVLAAADAYLSTSRWEGLPLAVLEAMAMRLPVILSDVVGHNDIMRSDNVGADFSLNDLDAAVHTLRLLKMNLPLRLRLGSNARAVQRRDYSFVGMCRSTLCVYEELSATHER